MSEDRRGRRLRISPARNFVLELMHHAMKVPSLPLARDTDVRSLVELRRKAGVSWTAVFSKAYSIVGQAIPELRRSFVRWPWPHFYEHPISECALLIERELDGESVVLGSKIRDPRNGSLRGIDDAIQRYRDKPVGEVSSFRQILRLGRLPAFLRRFLMWQTLNTSGYAKAKRLGTFAVSSLGNLGVEQMHPLCPLTTYLTFGPIREQGIVNVKIIYDHRVMDGRTVARTLIELERVLQADLRAELERMTTFSQRIDTLSP
ncbi:MAG: 2-oxo acid dehydrogenase subunit E2 [Gemmataceae bacterium]|nr:2-oxo acid dehydrogenase subunit E2 [Gemmataceae bacterium]